MAEVVRKIELRPHVGRTMSGLEVTFAQDQVFLNGVRIGYHGHAPGDMLALIRPVDAGTLDAINQAVDEKFPQRRKGVAVATPISDERESDE